MAPVFLYIASNRYLYNTRILKQVEYINIHLHIHIHIHIHLHLHLLSKSLTTAKYVFSHGEKLVRTHRKSMCPLLACLENQV